MNKLKFSIHLLIAVGVLFSFNAIDVNAQVETQGTKEQIWAQCPVTVEVRADPQMISLSNRTAKFSGKMTRTAVSGTGCYTYSDQVTINMSRLGFSNDFVTHSNDFGYFQTGTENHTFAGKQTSISGPLADGNEVPFDVRFLVTRTTQLNGIHQYEVGVPQVKFCVNRCGGPNPIPTGTMPTPTPIKSPNINLNTGYGGVPNYDANMGNFDNLVKPQSVPELIAQIIRILLVVIASIAVIIIIISGFRMVMYGSNPSELSKAKAAIVWAIVGLVVALMAFSIVAIIQGIIQKQ